jgi:hypothetical protein
MQAIVTDRTPGFYEALTVSNTAAGFSEAYKHPNTGQFKTMQAKEIFATVETDSIRYTIDGSTTPTDSVGHLVTAGQSISIKNVVAIQNFKMIRVTTDASVKITYFF